MRAAREIYATFFPDSGGFDAFIKEIGAALGRTRRVAPQTHAQNEFAQSAGDAVERPAVINF